MVLAGLGAGNDWRAVDIRCEAAGMVFKAEGPMAECAGEYRLNLLGRHQVTNALLALAVAVELGVPPEVVAEGLADCQPPRRRLQLWETHGVRVLDDAYNANADSVNAALQVLAELPCEGRRIAVLGDMAELGDATRAAHEEAGRRAAELKVDLLWAVGVQADVTVAAAREAGLDAVEAHADNAAAGQALRALARPGDLVLLKASRAAGLEEVGELLKGD